MMTPVVKRENPHKDRKKIRSRESNSPFWKLSKWVITLNEESNIGRCLASVRALADEIVVVDSGSTDRTVELARTAANGRARVVSAPDGGLARAVNQGFARSVTKEEALKIMRDAEEAEREAERIARLLAAGEKDVAWPCSATGRRPAG